MEKEHAVATLGQTSLLLPAWIKAALAANDRLKLYLSVLQSAAQHAASPTAASTPDWRQEMAQLGLHDADWLQNLAKSAYLQDKVLIVPELAEWLDALTADLATMARPVCEDNQHPQPDLIARRDTWLAYVEELRDEEGLQLRHLHSLTHGQRAKGDSFHLLVMDLHKHINAMSAQVATEDLDGAHVWQISDSDRPLISAFMQGLQRTAPLKFNHPGLETAVTRDGGRLLIQNDIGTNDAHVLVVQVEALTIRLTYSDLHAARFKFFQRMLERLGFAWEVLKPQTTIGLNEGKPYWVGHATLVATNEADLKHALEAASSRIVFVIDWNRARKRLLAFVAKPVAVAVLQHAADTDTGHMAWLLAGGERLVFEAMQAVDTEAFRVGERLDQVLGEAVTQAFLQDLLCMASTKLRQLQPMALIADEARLLLSRALRQRTHEFDLLAEHAAYCQAMAQALSLNLEAALPHAEVPPRAQRAKYWERQADHLLMEARRRAQRQPRWQPLVALLEVMDDTADALEEATFVHSMTQLPPLNGLPEPVNSVLRELADTTLAAIQDQIKAIEIARHMSDHAEATDSEVFLQTLWRMLRAERICDDLLRTARIRIVQTLSTQVAAYALATELAKTIETATDSLLTAGHALRELVFQKTGMTP